MISRGVVTWADFGSPRGSEPAKIRPVVVIQDNWLLATEIATVLVVPLTSNTALTPFPGNVLVPAPVSGLDKDSVAVVSQVGPVSREFLDPYPVSQLPGFLLSEIAAGVRLVLGV